VPARSFGPFLSVSLALVAHAPRDGWAEPAAEEGTISESVTRSTSAAEQRAERERTWRGLDALSWGAVGIEFLLANSLALRFTVLSGDISDAADATLWVIPPLVGPGFGVAEYWVRAPGWIARGLHGGFWTGYLGGLLAGLLHASFRDGPGLRFETPALVGLLAGMVPGLVIGATQIDRPEEVGPWLGLPPAGMLAGVVVAAVVFVSAFLAGDDPGPRAGDQILGWCFFGASSVAMSAAVASVM